MAKSIFYSVLTPIIVIGATIGLFFLLRPEETTTLFWINMGYITFLECLFFGWYFHRNRHQTSMFGTIFGTHMVYYILLSLLLIIGFSLANIFVEGDNRVLIKWYLVSIIVVTLLWFLTIVLIGNHDANYHEQQTKLETKTQDIRLLTQQLKQIAVDKGTAETQQDWNALLRAFSAIPPARINASNYAVLEEIVQEAQNADASAIPFRQLINRIKLI